MPEQARHPLYEFGYEGLVNRLHPSRTASHEDSMRRDSEPRQMFLEEINVVGAESLQAVKFFITIYIYLLVRGF
jgi:hypothetical protein